MQVISKRSLIQIEFTSDEIVALLHILAEYENSSNTDYGQFVGELRKSIS